MISKFVKYGLMMSKFVKPQRLFKIKNFSILLLSGTLATGYLLHQNNLLSKINCQNNNKPQDPTIFLSNKIP